VLSGAFVLCCWDICLLSHPSFELQGALSATPVACPPSLILLLVVPGQSPRLPHGLDCHLPLPGWRSVCEVSE
jgi:hypothetical protein